MSVLAGTRIVTPGDWTDLDLDPSTRHSSISRAVRLAVARDPGLAGNAVRLIGLLDDVARRAYDAGAFFCSSLVLSSDDGFLAANVLLQAAPMSDDDSAPLPSATDASSALAAAISCDPDWQDADVTVVALPSAGPAVRVEVVSGGICLQYHVPLPASSIHLVLTFTSPCASHVEALVDLFDAMAASLTLEYEPDRSDEVSAAR